MTCAHKPRLALQHGFRRGVGFLQIDAPISKFLERNSCAGHRAAHKRSRTHHAEIAVQIFDLGLAGQGMNDRCD